MEHQKVMMPQAPLALTIVGALPFLVLAFLPKSFFFRDLSFTVFIYGTLVLSFLGGINWGMSLLYEKKYYLWSVIPCIFSAALVFFYHLNERADNIFHYWGFLLAAFIVQYAIDIYIAAQDERLLWTKMQRTIGTLLIVILMLIITIRLAI